MAEAPELPALKLGTEDGAMREALDSTWFILSLSTLAGNASLVAFKERLNILVMLIFTGIRNPRS